MASPSSGRRDPARTLDLLWQTQAPPRRGPRGTLSAERIVREAVAIADAEGLAAVSMRRVAERLGVTTMSLYRYVPGKDDLQEMMFDHASGVPDTSRWSPGGAWRAQLEDFGRQLWAMYGTRPWLLDIPISSPPLGPNHLRWMEAALTAMARSGLAESDKVRALLLITGYVRGQAATEQAMHRAATSTGVTPREWSSGTYADMLSRALADGGFPAISRLVGAGVFNGPDDEPDGDFRYGLARILDGVAVLVAATGTGPPHAATPSPPS